MNFEWDILVWQHFCLKYVYTLVVSSLFMNCRYQRKTKTISMFYNGAVTNIENSLVEGLEEEHFNTQKIVEKLRLGQYLLSDRVYAYSFSGKITDFNGWSQSLDSDYLEDWMNCEEKVLYPAPDLGWLNRHQLS